VRGTAFARAPVRARRARLGRVCAIIASAGATAADRCYYANAITASVIV
jgi:hypothetical protein